MATHGAAFDKYLSQRKRDPAFAKEFANARAEIDAIDRLVRSLDEVRETKGVSKAALARAIGARPEMVRRLMTAERQNPTLRTVIKVASELGCHLELVPDRSGRRARAHRAERRAG